MLPSLHVPRIENFGLRTSQNAVRDACYRLLALVKFWLGLRSVSALLEPESDDGCRMTTVNSPTLLVEIESLMS